MRKCNLWNPPVLPCQGKEKLGEDHPQTLGSLNTLASLLHDQGYLADAEDLFREALEKSPEAQLQGSKGLRLTAGRRPRKGRAKGTAVVGVVMVVVGDGGSGIVVVVGAGAVLVVFEVLVLVLVLVWVWVWCFWLWL